MEKSSDMKANPLVSIIVPTMNSTPTIRRCQDAIKNQSYGEVEVIIVDSSVDETPKVALGYGCKVARANASMTRARNIGASMSKGKYLFYLDSDMILRSETIAECVSLCESGADAVNVLQEYEGVGLWGKCRQAELEMYKRYPSLKLARFVTANASSAIGGYDESLESGEDWDFRVRLELGGFRIATSTACVVHGWGKISLARIVRKSYRYGKSIRRYTQKHPRIAAEQWGYPRFVFLINNGMRKYPKYVLGILLMKSLEFFAGYVGGKAIGAGSGSVAAGV
jgi:glycosyltransferase involved in cell wall biosynthesis